MSTMNEIGLSVVALLVGVGGLLAEIWQHRYAARPRKNQR